VLGKRDRIRDVPVPPSVLRRLDRLIAGRPEERVTEQIFLCLRRGRLGDYEALTLGGVYQVVKEAVARAGITKRVYPHLLRHSWMTEMLRCGMNPIQLSFIAGASPEVIAQHYAHLTQDDAYEAMLRALSGPRR
jgi:integrase/recombinase XerD